MRFSIYIETTNDYDPDKVMATLQKAIELGINALNIKARVTADAVTHAYTCEILDNGITVDCDDEH
ncbi:MAG: hypothetical protein ACKV1O_30890 [Saprospiraceae bacterium]